MEREKARQRVTDAMVRTAKAGQVTGGRCFGYDNVRIDASTVIRRVNAAEAAVVRQVFALSAQGCGLKQIAHRLNEAGARQLLELLLDGVIVFTPGKNRHGFDAYHVAVPLALDRLFEGELPMDLASPTGLDEVWTTIKASVPHGVKAQAYAARAIAAVRDSLNPVPAACKSRWSGWEGSPASSPPRSRHPGSVGGSDGGRSWFPARPSLDITSRGSSR